MSLQHQQTPLTIGLFGFGVVGEGLYQVLANTPSLRATIKKICIKDETKFRNAPASLFTTNANDILNDEHINVVVELISDAEAAFGIVTTALRGRKAVVSANKKLIAGHLETLLQLQRDFDTPFLYEAAACASIPVIRNLEEYYDNDLLKSICGIVNGSTNYILTRVLEERKPFADALRLAQEAGFAEADPTLDVEGYDAQNKLTLLLAHAYGIITPPEAILCSGITALKPEDAIYAREKGYRIRLVAQAHKLRDDTVAAFVLPQFVGPDSQLFHVRDENNGVILSSNLADKQFFYGKGAGSYPTASAVLSDLSALRYGYRYEYKKLSYQQPALLAADFHLRVYVQYSAGFRLPEECFETILEWNRTTQTAYVVGIIAASELLFSTWWKSPGVSLVLLPEGLAESEELFSETGLEVLEAV